MPERRMFSEATTQHPSVEITDDLKKKITTAESELATLAQMIGADFGMRVKFGELGKGSFFNPDKNSIDLDPALLAEGKEYQAEFVAGHEGGHRAITRTPEQFGVDKDKARELYKKLGFGYLNNCVEDCADNDWVGGKFAKFKDASDKVYAEQFTQENTAMITPEIENIISRLGYTPKFVSYGSEIIRRWATGRQSQELDPAVSEALEKTVDAARQAWEEIPGEYAKESQRLAKAKERFRLIFEHLWPEFEKLVKTDVDDEKMRELANEINKAREGLPEDLQKELQEKIEENSSGQKEKSGGQSPEGESEKPAGQEAPDEPVQPVGQEKNCVPWDKLSDELKKKLKEIYRKLSKEEKEELAARAEKTLAELDDKLLEATRGKLTGEKSPPTHKEIAEAEAKEKETAEAAEKKDGERAREQAEREAMLEKIKSEIEAGLNEYDRIYKEVAPLVDELYERIHQIFLPQRHPRWEKGKPTGQRLDLFKVMQFQADRTLYDKLWERKTIPKKIDYRFTLLVDLSGSMDGQKIEQTFRGAIVLAEVLNRLGIKTQIFGFQDELIPYSGFDQDLSPETRRKMAGMRREVTNDGSHNMARYNSDGFCLQEAASLSEKNKGKDNFLLVLSDGNPAPDPKHRTDDYDLHKVVDDIRKKTKIKLVGVGLGPDTEHVADYYPTSLPNVDIKQLPRLLGELLEDMIKHPGRYK